MIARTGTKVCGYLSLGEIRTSDPFMEFLDPAALLPENPDWPGTRRVDIRHPSWRSLVLDRRIPSLASQGFTGVMLDTLDTPPYLELLDPARYHGMREAAIALVDAIRARWPETMLIMNRGYALLPDVVQKVDAVIAESLMTSPDRHTGGFAWVESPKWNCNSNCYIRRYAGARRCRSSASTTGILTIRERLQKSTVGSAYSGTIHTSLRGCSTKSCRRKAESLSRRRWTGERRTANVI